MTTHTTENDATEFDVDKLVSQQHSLKRQGKLHWVHWWIIGLSVVMTFLGWRLSESLLKRSEIDRFEIEAQRLVNQMTVRMAHYEDALIAGVAALQSHQNSMSRDQWKHYANSLDLINRYPGINGIGLISEVDARDLASFELNQQDSWPGFNVFPKHSFPSHFPIVYIEPAQENAAAVGLDVAFETNRRTAAIQARNQNATQITGPIELVQDDGKTPGFLFYAPYYTNGTSFEGLVYAPLVVRNFVEGVLGDKAKQMLFSIRDGDSVLYNESTDHTGDTHSTSHKAEITKDFYGRQWTFTIHTAHGFTSASGLTQPTVVLICGLMIEVMLLVLFLLLTRSNQRVLNLAHAMTDTLGKQTKVLADKNDELESFAHIVSHDLKTPIRAIQNLTLFIKEDLEDLSASEKVQTTVASHVLRINEQAERGHALIKGLLNYSMVGHETDKQEAVDTEQLVRGIGEALGLNSQQLSIESPLPDLYTYAVPLTQVFENLIGNAIKYHPTPETANIVVSVTLNTQFYRFSIADNGNGIDDKYHESVFKPFTMLQPHVTLDSSGIGLSIVKKTVEGMGGVVGIVPDTASGAEFYFDWPLTHNLAHPELRHAA